MPNSMTTSDVIRALNNRNFQTFENLDEVVNIIKSVSKEDAPDLKKALHEALPWLEQRLNKLKMVSEEMEGHYWTLVNS
jgi:hypothetical protein